MIDIAELRDIFMDARVDVDDYFEEALAEFTAPDDRLQIAISASTMPPEVMALVDKQTVKKIMEVFNARR